MILFITVLAIAGIIGYYFLMLKTKQDEKNKSKAKSAADILSVEHSAADYSEVIDDYPTYHRQVK